MKCNHCGTENQEGASFCAGCGQPLSAQDAVQLRKEEPAEEQQSRQQEVEQGQQASVQPQQPRQQEVAQGQQVPEQQAAQQFQQQIPVQPQQAYQQVPMQPQVQIQPQVTYNPNIELPIPEEYRPIGMWGYFGYELLFSIPCVGLILLIVFSFAPRNKNLKNFARSYFCYLIIIVVLSAVLLIVFGGTGLLAELLDSLNH